MRIRINSHVMMKKLMPNVSREYKQLWKIPDQYQNIGIISCDIEDVMYMALDDATKKADITVVYVETIYGELGHAWSRYGGEITAVIAGEKVSDVRSGLAYTADFIEHKTQMFMLNEEHTMGYYAQCVPKAGKYYREKLGISEGTAYAYLVSTPLESMYALDKALKASKTSIKEMFVPPSRVNTGGAVVVGTESDCQAAVRAFAEAVEYCCKNPMKME